MAREDNKYVDLPSLSTDDWLRGKLADPWGGDNISSQLKDFQLREIATRFHTYDTEIKVKILLAILNMKKRRLTELQRELESVVKAAESDEDPWVKVMVWVLRGYISKRTLTLDFSQCDNMLGEARKELWAALDEGPPSFLPLENVFLDKSIADVSFSQPIQHFAIKAPPLRAEQLKAKLQEIAATAEQETLSDIKTASARQLSTGLKSGERRPFVAGRLSSTLKSRSSLGLGPGSAATQAGGKKYLESKKHVVVLNQEESLTLAKTAEKRKKTEEETLQEELERQKKREEKKRREAEEKERRRQERENQRLARRRSQAETIQNIPTIPEPSRQEEAVMAAAPTNDNGQTEETPGQGRLNVAVDDLMQNPLQGQEVAEANDTQSFQFQYLQDIQRQQLVLQQQQLLKQQLAQQSEQAQQQELLQQTQQEALQRQLLLQGQAGQSSYQNQQSISQQNPMYWPRYQGQVPATSPAMAPEPITANGGTADPNSFLNVYSTRGTDTGYDAYAGQYAQDRTMLADQELASVGLERLQQLQQEHLCLQQILQANPQDMATRQECARVENEYKMLYAMQMNRPQAAIPAVYARYLLGHAGTGYGSTAQQSQGASYFAQTFSKVNRLTAEQQNEIVRYIQGERENRPPNLPDGKLSIVMNEEVVEIERETFLEQIIFEMDYDNKTWKRLKRKRAYSQQ